MSNHEFGGKGERSRQDLFTKTGKLALALVLSGTAVLGLTGCDGDKVPKEVSFAVNCSDPDNNNQTPVIDSIKQDSPYGEEATKRVEFVCPDGT